jgi:hypothetical protein
MIKELDAEVCDLAPPKLREGAAQQKFNQGTNAGNTIINN